LASKTLSYYADETLAAWMSEQTVREGRTASQIIGDALRLYRDLPDVARRGLRVARHHGRSEAAMRAAARAILLALETESRAEIARQIRASGQDIEEGEEDILAEAVRLTESA
jgi:hypothetical protein